jgi:hypothetical protein
MKLRPANAPAGEGGAQPLGLDAAQQPPLRPGLDAAGAARAAGVERRRLREAAAKVGEAAAQVGEATTKVGEAAAAAQRAQAAVAPRRRQTGRPPQPRRLRYCRACYCPRYCRRRRPAVVVRAHAAGGRAGRRAAGAGGPVRVGKAIREVLQGGEGVELQVGDGAWVGG